MTQGDDVLALGVNLRQQHRGLVGLGAAVGEERFFQPPRRDLRELFRQPHLRLIGVERRHVLHLMGLLVNGAGDFVVAVADADRENAAEEIQILLALNVIDVLILRMFDHQRLVIVRRHAREQILLLLLENFFFVHKLRA